MSQTLLLVFLAAAGLSAAEPSSVSTEASKGFTWPSQVPVDCPFPKSNRLAGVFFSGRHSDYHCGDTWYPCWASDGNLYSPWTDGNTDGVSCGSWPGAKAQTAPRDPRWRRPAETQDPQHIPAQAGQCLALSGPLPGRFPGAQRHLVLRYLLSGTRPVLQAQRVSLELAQPGTDAGIPDLSRLRQDVGAVAAHAGKALVPGAAQARRPGQDGSPAFCGLRQEHGAFPGWQGLPARHGCGRKRSQAEALHQARKAGRGIPGGRGLHERLRPRQPELDHGRPGLSGPREALAGNDQ